MGAIDCADAKYLRMQVEKGGPTPEEFDEINAVFHHMGDVVRSGRASRAEINAEFRSIIKPLLGKPDNMTAKAVLKPYGYSGDFEIIDNFYTYWVSSNPLFTNWDYLAQAQPASQAVRNRKKYFIAKANERYAHSSDKEYRVLDVGSGPGRDVLEFFKQNDGKNIRDVNIDCIDMDEHAIEYASQLCVQYKSHINFHKVNAFRYRTEEKYDFIWSAGLFDYLNDAQFVFLLKRLYGLLRPNGMVIVGNFSVDNPSRDYIEAADWYLHHRTDEDLVRLAQEVNIPEEKIRIEREEEGINLFLVVSV